MSWKDLMNYLHRKKNRIKDILETKIKMKEIHLNLSMKMNNKNITTVDVLNDEMQINKKIQEED
mgnify:CR=1 FL=1